VRMMRYAMDAGRCSVDARGGGDRGTNAYEWSSHASMGEATRAVGQAAAGIHGGAAGARWSLSGCAAELAHRPLTSSGAVPLKVITSAQDEPGGKSGVRHAAREGQ